MMLDGSVALHQLLKTLFTIKWLRGFAAELETFVRPDVIVRLLAEVAKIVVAQP